MKIDHLLMFVGGSGEEVSELEAMGLLSGRKVRHQGQGTRNTCFAFDNTYLELVWHDPEFAITSELVAKTALPKRCHWWKNAYCPFGIAVCLEAQQVTAPFEVWEYRPPYAPEQAAIWMSEASGDAAQPLLFVMPEVPWDSNHKAQSSLGMNRLTQCTITLPENHRPSTAALSLDKKGLIKVEMGCGYYMTLEIDHGRQGQSYRCKHPRLPLTFNW